MLKRLIRHLWTLRREFAKYFFVGVSGVVLDIGTLVFFKRGLGISPVAAVILNQPIVLVYNFLLNKYWSFQNKTLSHWQLVRYLLIAGCNYGFSAFAMYVLADHLHANYIASRLVTIAIMVMWNFFLYKYWVYADRHDMGSSKDSVHNIIPRVP